MKIALVHDWLNGMRGGEKVLENLCELFPNATIFTLLYQPELVSDKIRTMRIISSPILPKLPFGIKKYRYYLPVFPMLIEQFNLKGFDLIISTSHCVAKGVIPQLGTVHLCYCFTPMRYLWDRYNEYFSSHKSSVLTRLFAPWVMNYVRIWDQSTINRVDKFIAISNYIARKIKKYYHRDALILYPPVDTEFYRPQSNSLKDYYLIVSALVPYKRIDIAIDAFNQSNRRLLIAGIGPEFDRLKSKSNSNITFLGWQDDEKLRELYSECRGFIFPGEEDFGITPLEAMSCGRPVIAYGKGGLLETVQSGRTGLFFHESNSIALIKILDEFEKMTFDGGQIRQSVLSFDKILFKIQFQKLVNESVQSPKFAELSERVKF